MLFSLQNYLWNNKRNKKGKNKSPAEGKAKEVVWQLTQTMTSFWKTKQREQTNGKTSTKLKNSKTKRRFSKKGSFPRRSPEQLQAQRSLEQVQKQATGNRATEQLQQAPPHVRKTLASAPGIKGVRAWLEVGVLPRESPRVGAWAATRISPSPSPTLSQQQHRNRASIIRTSIRCQSNRVSHFR